LPETTSYLTHLECSQCGRSFDAGQLQTFCPDCQAPLLARYDLAAAPLLAADLDLEALQVLVPPYYTIRAVPIFPPVLEDIAVIVDEDLPAERVVEAIRKAGGKLLSDVRLFDIFRGGQIGAGKKSLAYSLTYQSHDRTLTDSEAAKVRQRIVQSLEKELGAKLRS